MPPHTIRRTSVLDLLLAAVFGAMFMFLHQRSVAKLNTPERKAVFDFSEALPIDDGWHPIHVFYGDRSALPGSDQEWFSQVKQDELVLSLLGDNGYFIDLAANDASHLSNTLALERHGWKGLCVEPNPSYWYGLSHRKCTVVAAPVGGKVEKIKFNFVGGVLGQIVGVENVVPGFDIGPVTEGEWRYTVSFADVLKRFNVPKSIDYLSLDTEGAELLIMKEFPFDQYKIKIMTIERPGQDLRTLLESKGYIFLKDLVWWGETLWAHKSLGLSPEHPDVKKIQTQ
jgi:Methyltransferase FkbM domain